MTINLSRKRTLNSFFRDHQREILIGFCVLLVLFVSLIFPQKSSGESFWLSLFLFLLFPFLAIRFLLKEPLKDFGLSRGDFRSGVIFSSIVTVVFVFISYLIVSRPELLNQLPVTPGIAENYWYFLLFELFLVLPLHFFWEFFFRGFLQLGLEKRMGVYSLFLQAFLQTIFVLRGPWIFSSLIFFSALSAGFIARKSRSMIYSFVSLWIISISLDIMIIRAIHQMAK